MAKEAVAGATATVPGLTVMVEVAICFVSATLRAVTTTFCEAETADGAVYRPVLSMVPTFGASDQVTDVLADPNTVAARVVESPDKTVEAEGLRVTDTCGTKVIFA
jgi:hypothetical protein